MINKEKQFWTADDIKDPIFREEMAWRIELHEIDNHFKNTAIAFVLLVLVSLVIVCFF